MNAPPTGTGHSTNDQLRDHHRETMMPVDDYPKTFTLKDGRRIVIRPLARGDFEQLHAFFLNLPEEDRIFLRHDVRNPDVTRKWTEQLDLERVLPLVTLDGDRIVGDGTLHFSPDPWMQHLGHLRLVTAATHRRVGMGVILARELVSLATERNLEKLQAQVIEDDIGAVKMLDAVGFRKVAVLPDFVKDINGQNRNLLVMLNDVSQLGRAMEDWIQDSMIPAYRVPGAGA